MGRAPCCDKANVKKGPWSPEEDAKLKAYIEQNGTGGNWIALPQKIGLKRCGKSCRLRWLNYLRPNIKHGGFSEEEDNIICSLYISIGSRWSIIAAQLPGRTDNDIKNYWNTRLKKKLLGKCKESHTSRISPAIIKDVNEDFDGLKEVPDSVASQRGLDSLSLSALERIQLHIQLQCLQDTCSFFNPLAIFHGRRNQPLCDTNLPTTENHLSEGLESLGASPLDQTQANIGVSDHNQNSFNGFSSSRYVSHTESTCISQDAVQSFKSIDDFATQLQDMLNYNYQQALGFDCLKEIPGTDTGIMWWGDDSDQSAIISCVSSGVLHPESFPLQDFRMDQYGLL